MEGINKYCCNFHLDMAFDDFLLETETFPVLKIASSKKCSYCNNEATYVLIKPQKNIYADTL